MQHYDGQVLCDGSRRRRRFLHAKHFLDHSVHTVMAPYCTHRTCHGQTVTYSFMSFCLTCPPWLPEHPWPTKKIFYEWVWSWFTAEPLRKHKIGFKETLKRLYLRIVSKSCLSGLRRSKGKIMIQWVCHDHNHPRYPFLSGIQSLVSDSIVRLGGFGQDGL